MKLSGETGDSAEPRAAVIPKPRSVEIKRGEFQLHSRTSIVADAALLRQAQLLQRALVVATGYRVPIVSRAAGQRIELHLSRSPARLGPEGYELDVSKQRIAMRAGAEAGLFYAIQSLLLLMPPEIFRRACIENVRWRVPCIAVEDAPRFSWRGLLLDVARHFLPKEFILKMLDLMALYKLNVLQLHLTDDQGWRIEIRRYPRLTEIGARSDYSASHAAAEPARPRSQHPGGFYTQQDIREIVRYAAERCITVVPEIEMPAHAGAAILAYRELGKHGVFNAEDSTIAMLKNVLDEVLELFPSKFVHIGGDEVPWKVWRSDRRAQQRLRTLGLRDEKELQSWFIKEFDRYLTARGRRLVGWDEILEGGLAPGAAVMSWRGVAGGVAAVKAGHNAIMAPAEETYFDAYQRQPTALEPRAIGNYLPIEKVYKFEPIVPTLSADESKRVLGAQASLWGEYVSQPKHAEYMAFPRLLAFAEAVWSEPRSRNWRSFVTRLSANFKKLSALDVNFCPYRTEPAAVARWTPDVAGARWTVCDWDITAAVTAPGQYNVVFADDIGHLEVQWIAVFGNAQRSRETNNLKKSFSKDDDKVFAIIVPPSRSTPYTLRARVRVRHANAEKPSGRIYVVPGSTQ